VKKQKGDQEQETRRKAQRKRQRRRKRKKLSIFFSFLQSSGEEKGIKTENITKLRT
jgi:hypothetical protein